MGGDMGAVESVERDGVRIAFEVDAGPPGGGDPVVLVHGITEDRTTWGPVVAPLAARRTVVRVDLRGHGESSDPDDGDYGIDVLAADVAAVVARVGLARPHLVGHSLGGAVVTFLAASISAGSIVNVDQQLRLAEMAVMLKPFEPMLRGPDFAEVLAGLFAALGVDQVPEPYQSALRAQHRAARSEVVFGIWNLLLTAPAGELEALVDKALHGVDAPYLSLHGSDPGDGYETWLRGSLPQATVEVWDGLGHYPHLVEPERFVARVEAFVVDAGR